MRIDLPQCNFEYCKYSFDGNCTSKNKYNKCEYNLLNKILKEVLIQNDGCRNHCIYSYYVKGIPYDCDNEDDCKNHSMYQIDFEKVIKDYEIELEDN